MFKSIQLINFYSFGDKSEKIQLNPDTNLFVGINGSGKSNILRAIQLLSSGIAEGGSFQTIFNQWGGFDSILNFSGEKKSDSKISLVFESDINVLSTVNGATIPFLSAPFYEIVIHRGNHIGYFLEESVFIENTDGNRFYFLKMVAGAGTVSEYAGDSNVTWENIHQQYKSIHYAAFEAFDGQELVLKQIADPKRFYALFLLKKSLEALAVYASFDTTSSSIIRRLGEYSPYRQLLPDGRNLTQFLQRLSVNHPLVFDKIVELLNKVNPFFKDIRFDYLGKNFGLVLIETKLSRPVSLDSLSDGTLRFLILMSILLNPERGHLICLDEPETSLHPDMISVFSDIIRESNQQGTQVVIATHSPMLLNMFDLDQVFVVEKDAVTNSTIVSTRSEEDFDTWVEEFLPGKLWLQGLIGARR